MRKCRSPRSLVLGIRNLLWFLVRSECYFWALTWAAQPGGCVEDIVPLTFGTRRLQGVQ